MGFSPPEAGQWQRIAPYLDQALDLAQLLDQAALYTKLDCCSGPRSQALVARAGVRLTEHQLDAAAHDAQDAVKFAEQGQGQLPSSSTTGQAWLMLAEVEQAQGRAGEARHAYDLAVRNLLETLGEQHPDTVRARKGMGDT